VLVAVVCIALQHTSLSIENHMNLPTKD